MKGKNMSPSEIVARRAVAPLLLIFVTVTWLGYYDCKVFGGPLTLPYTVNRETHSMVPYYIWQNPRPEPADPDSAMRAFYKVELAICEQERSVKGYLLWMVAKVVFLVPFFTGVILLVPLVMARRAFGDRRLRLLVVCVLVLVAGMAIGIYFEAYYLAPFVAAMYAVELQMMRHLRVGRNGQSTVGLALTRFIITACVVMTGVRVLFAPLHLEPAEGNPGK